MYQKMQKPAGKAGFYTKGAEWGMDDCDKPVVKSRVESVNIPYSHLFHARAVSLLWLIGRHDGEIVLDGAAMRRLRWGLGCTRGQIERLVDDLVEAGALQVRAEGGEVKVAHA